MFKKPNITEDNITARQLYEGGVPEDVKNKFIERQAELRKDMLDRSNAAMQSIWHDPSKLSELIGVMEHFSREGTKLGGGFDNALCIYQKYGTTATQLISNTEIEGLNIYKKQGTQAISISISEEGKQMQRYRTIIKAFDISQLQESQMLESVIDIPAPPKASLAEIIKAIVAMERHWNFETAHSTKLDSSAFVPREADKPAQLIISDKLGAEPQRLMQEVCYCFSHLVMTFQQGYTVSPETEFIARCSADFLCKRYGFEARVLKKEDFPGEIQTLSQGKELLSTANRIAKTSANLLKELIARERDIAQKNVLENAQH